MTTKHTILGNKKVSSRTLSHWGKTGGRPAKYNSRAARLAARKIQRAIRLGKNPDELRSYKTITETQGQPTSWKFEGQCDNCGSKVWGGNPNTEGQQCQTCHWGSYQRITSNILTIKRAMTGSERMKAYRDRLKNK
jgi:hypothetical protein